MTKFDPLQSITVDSGSSLDKKRQGIISVARTRRTVRLTTLIGVIPFIFFTFFIWLIDKGNPQWMIAVDGLKTYAAVILSFLGGTRWGLALRSDSEEDMGSTLLKSAVPVLAGWVSLILPMPYVFGVLALTFAGQGAWDSFAGQRGVFGLWYAQLRTIATIAVTGTLVVAFFATL